MAQHKTLSNEKRQKPPNSLVRKYVVMALLIVMVGLIIFGGILLAFSKEYFEQQTWVNLDESATAGSRYTTFCFSSTENGSLAVNLKNVRTGLSILSSRPGYTIFLTDARGNILLYVDGSKSASNTQFPSVRRVPPAPLKAIQSNGFYHDFSSLNGVYSSTQQIVALPVTSLDNQVVAYLFTSSAGNDLNEFLRKIVEIFVLGAVAVLAFTFTMMSIGTERFMAPLKEMSTATKAFAAGDFSKRVPIEPGSFDEMNQLAFAFNNMASALSIHEKSSRNFVANVSHELKTPMTTIGGFVDGILDHTIPPQEERHYLTIVSSEVKRLSRMVTSMLSLSRMEAGELKIKPQNFDLRETVFQTLLGFEKRIEEKNLDIRGLEETRESQWVFADPDMIHQVVYNLVENAIKFVNENGFLSFTFSHAEKMCYLGIQNSGEGISKEEIQQIFDRFYKSDKSRSLDKSGVGLGLYIVKSIMTMHGGDISVRSVEGEFCEFTIALPEGKAFEEK